MFCLFTIILPFLVTALNIIYISDIDELSSKELVQKMKCKNPNNIIIGHLNINSIRQKLELLMEIIGTNIDLLPISETKLNATFPIGQFFIDGFHVPFREDRNKGGGLLLYVRNHIPCRRLILYLRLGNCNRNQF